MSKIKTAFNLLINDPGKIVYVLGRKDLLNWVPDKIYLKMIYYGQMGKKLNLKNPQTFNEKLQWLKLYDRRSEYINYVDKYAVRYYIEKTIGEKYLVPLISVHDNVEEIPWAELPDKFVLKCTHGSGCNIICENKQKLDSVLATRQLKRWLKTNYYYHSREWPYKYVKPRIICETYLQKEIIDYKFYCFNGIPRFLYLAQGSNPEGTLKMSFFDMEFKKCNFYRPDHKPLNFEPCKPDNFQEMVEIAKKLSRNMPFVRIDLFNVQGEIYFSEITLTPGAGFTPFSPIEKEIEIGNYIDLKGI
jgi:hypothetical protein